METFETWSRMEFIGLSRYGNTASSFYLVDFTDRPTV
jgi:hypothetical protein